MSTVQTTTSRAASRRRYVAAGIAAAAGLLAAIIWSALTLLPLVGELDAMPRIEAPGEGAVIIDEPSEQVIYHEQETWIATFPTDPDLEVTVTGPDGEPTPVEPYGTTVTYRLPGLAGQAHATFEAEQAGGYTVAVHGADGAVDRVAVGPNLTTPLMRGIVGALVLFLAGAAGAIILVVRASAGSDAA